MTDRVMQRERSRCANMATMTTRGIGITCLVGLLACGEPARTPSAPAPTATHAEGIGLGNGPGAIAKRPIDPAKVRGRLPPEVIQKTVRANFDGLRRCYEEGLGRNPKLAGKISTRFVIELDGHVSSAIEIHDTPPDPLTASLPRSDITDGREAPRFPDAKVEACVVARFTTMTFPKPEGGIVTVVYPVVFDPAD